jgi:hypothetical protein
MNLESHGQTLVVKDAINLCLRTSEKPHVCIGPSKRSGDHGHIVVENYNTLCVSELLRVLPARCRVYSRAPVTGVKRVTQSRLDIYYPLDGTLWRWKTSVLVLVWILVPLIASVVIILV